MSSLVTRSRFWHLLDFTADGAAQADWFWQHKLLIGGDQHGTLWGMVDVERGGQRAIPSRAVMVKCIRDFCARHKALRGRDATLYGGELLRAFGITLAEVGAGRSMVALYNNELHGQGETTKQFFARTGTDGEHTRWWQYAGAINATTVESFLKNKAGERYPDHAPGATAAFDISVPTTPAGTDGLAGLRAELAA